VIFETQITPGSIRANPALLERAVLNVLDNAAKWSPPNGTVTIWLQRRDIWTLDVRDQGPGIDAEDLPRVFDRFYRAQTARSMAGSGLGLAIVRKVIGDHGGTVVASNPPGGGTLIHIELPTVAEHEPDAVAPSSETEPGEPYLVGKAVYPPGWVHPGDDISPAPSPTMGSTAR
jgi:two-component system, OmpR family, sensor histidine kinase MprB